MIALPICRVFGSAERVERTGTVDLIVTLPGSDPLSAEVLGEIVGILDRGGCIAFHATSHDAIDAAAKAFLPMLGGGQT